MGWMRAMTRACGFTPAILVASLLVSMVQTRPLKGQQTGTIRGRVQASITGEPLEGVRIVVAETGMAVLSGSGGEFLISDVPAGATNLRLELLPEFVTSIEQVAVRPGVTTRVSFEMTPQAVLLDELLVQSRPFPSDAVVRVFQEGEAREMTGGGTAVDLLSASFAAVQVNRGSGQVGTGTSILIRGTNSITQPGDPLVFVDGVRVGRAQGHQGGEAGFVLSFLDMIPADQVARIEVLKGPAATRFGVGSSNGVILIFTR